jgi:hypothetical protein
MGACEVAAIFAALKPGKICRTCHFIYEDGSLSARATTLNYSMSALSLQ